MLLDMRPDHLKIVQDILQQHVPTREVWAFGSRAKWTAKEYSDLDLCIMGDTPLSFSTLGLLDEAFAESDLPYKVDVLDWATTSEAFRKIIERDRVVVQVGDRTVGEKKKQPEWPESTLGDVCERITNGAHQSPPSVANGYPMASVKDLTFYGLNLESARRISILDYELLVRQGCQPIENDVLIAKDGNSALDTVCVLKESVSAVLLSSVAILRPKKYQIDPEYLYFYFRDQSTISYLKGNFISGAAIPRVVLRDLKKAKIRLPPLIEQRAITSILGPLNDKIDQNQQMNETLEAMARAGFKDWFVDFSPTRAKMAGRAPYLPAEIWSLFPDRLDDEGKPEGWHLMSLADVSSELRRGLSPKYLESGGIRVLNQKCIRDNSVSFAAARRHDGSAKPVGDRILALGDVLINSTGVGTLGRVGQVWALDEITIVDSHVTVVRAAPQKITPIYLGINLISRASEIEALGEGSTGQTELSRVRLGMLPVLVPSKRCLDRFEDTVGGFIRQITANATQSQTLAATRDLLLPKLMSGEIRVREAEKMVEEVL